MLSSNCVRSAVQCGEHKSTLLMIKLDVTLNNSVNALSLVYEKRASQQKGRKEADGKLRKGRVLC